MNNGDVIYFKKAKEHPTRKSIELEFKGHAFGILLGHVPPFAQEPPKDHVVRLLGSIGYLSFDDVGEFLGNEVGADVVKKFEEKYYAQPTQQQELPLAPSGLVDTSGAPIGAEPQTEAVTDGVQGEATNGAV